MRRAVTGIILGLMPKSARHRLIAMRRRPLFESFRKAGVVYIHVPRTAGTSISEAVFDSWIDHFALKGHLATMPAEVLALPRFTVVRNPWDRALSSWSFASAGTGLDSRIYVHHRHKYRTEGFRTFERFVLEWLPEQDIDSCDPLFRLQSGLLTDESGALPFDHIGRFEDLALTQDWLSERLGRKIVLPHHNRSSHSSYRDCFTNEMRDSIARIYGEDVQRLGYDF